MVRPACPRCTQELVKNESGNVLRYSCSKCFGFAIHFPVLEELMPADEVEVLRKGAEHAPTGNLRCSQCRAPMQVLLRDHGVRNMELDLCQRCEVLWLDNGEGQDLSSLETDRVMNFGEATKMPLPKTVIALIGLPVEQDNDFFHRTPWLTWTMIFLCSVSSLLAFSNMEYALAQFGYFSNQPFPQNVLTAFTSFFIHGSLAHLLFNMYFFWIFGDNVEDNLGKFKYLLLVFGAAFLGDVIAGFMDPRLADIPGVGASGGISGLIAYYLIRFPYRRFVFMIFFRPFTIPALFLGGLYLLKEVAGAFAQVGGVSSVSHLAHLGGAAAGVILALWPARVSKRVNA
jgi:membrane associated rhomboid family serine protease/Zn-finger nucleic acid-binding protein